MPYQVVAGVLLVALGACGDGTDEQFRTRWENSDVSAYSMTYTSTCGENGWITFDPVEVTVEDQQILSHTGRPTNFTPLTVDAIFDLLDASKRADEISVELGAHGHPRAVSIDESTKAIDDEFCVQVGSFQVRDP